MCTCVCVCVCVCVYVCVHSCEPHTHSVLVKSMPRLACSRPPASVQSLQLCLLLSSHSLVPPHNSRRVPPLKADSIDTAPTKCPTLRHTSWWRLDTVLAVCWSVELQKDCLVVYTLTSGREGAGEDLTLEERLAHTILIFVFSQPSSFALESVQYVCLCQEVQCKLKSISVEYCVHSFMPPP